jgi:hypothetical protein
MSLRTVANAWSRFFFEPQSPVPVALYRILYGLLTIANLLYLFPDWLEWYGPHAWLSLTTMHQMEPGIRLNLFAVIPQTDLCVFAIFWIYFLFAFTLTVGLLTRLSTIVVFLCATSIQQRDLYILHAGDTLMRVTALFLIFAPAGAALSVDRLIRIWLGKEGSEVPLKSPWAQRMIQFEVAIVYLTGFWWKSMGTDWVSGNALYYVLHVAQMKRFPLPSFIYAPVLLKIGTWFTLAFEFSFGILVWFRETRYAVLIIGVLFHVAIEYTLNIQLFEWMMLASYVVFLPPDDLNRAGRWIVQKLERPAVRRIA